MPGDRKSYARRIEEESRSPYDNVSERSPFMFFSPKDSPSHHHHRQHSPSAKPLQQQVRRQIKGAERDVENSQDNAVLVSHQAKVFIQAIGLCISQVGSVEIVEEVHERQNRQQSTVAIVNKHVSSQGRHKYLKSSFLTTDRSTTGSITKDPAMETPASEIEGLLVFCRSDLDEVGSAMTVLPVMRLQGEKSKACLDVYYIPQRYL